MTAQHNLGNTEPGVAPPPESAPAKPAPSERIVRLCPTCDQHFSGDASFCPFDGDPLQVAVGYRPESAPLIGTVVDGRYEVQSVLGEGGMGTVYAVRHQSLDKMFALKVMRADLAAQGELAARFIQEARAAAAIGHPNIVQITDFGQLSTGAPYFVMELLVGTSLSKMIRTGGPLPAGQAVRILQQVAAGLAAAHAVGVIHRDLKPDNIHVAKGDVVKILDFGVAKMAGAGRLTRAGMVFGTPHYMSPEQASGGDVDHRADIYALGIIMYEMFTGRVPFEADSYMGVLTKHMFMIPEPPSKVNARARELGALEDVTLRCLEKKPEARYESMGALIREIESIVHFAGDRLQIARPSMEPRARYRGPSLADELEPPARDELRIPLRAAGLPTALPPLSIGLGALALAILMGGALFALTRPAPRTTANAPSAPSALPLAAPAATSEPAPPIAAIVPDPLAASFAPATPAPGSERSASAHSGSKPKSSRPPAPPSASPALGKAPPPPQFESGDIINPWAK